PVARDKEPDELPVRPPPEIDRKLKLGFGEGCPEEKRAIKLEMRAKGIVLAADSFSIEEDGRVKLMPFSVVLFGKEDEKQKTNQVEPKDPEINTVQSDIAYFRFDQPVHNIQEMTSRKIVGGELIGDRQRRQGPNAGGVTIRNNRKTSQPDDDIT